MLDLVPPVYLVALGLGVAAVFVVLFDSFTSNLNYEREWYGMPSWFDFMQWPMAHEQLELALLGIIIGALIMKK